MSKQVQVHGCRLYNYEVIVCNICCSRIEILDDVNRHVCLARRFDLRPLLCVLPGHFTQVVWKDSAELGVGMATNGNKVYVVGQYRPPGNMNTKEYFEKNVGPLGNFSVNPKAPSLIFQLSLCYNHIYTIIFFFIIFSFWSGLYRIQIPELR